MNVVIRGIIPIDVSTGPPSPALPLHSGRVTTHNGFYVNLLLGSRARRFRGLS
jgi:hypothetical protein